MPLTSTGYSKDEDTDAKDPGQGAETRHEDRRLSRMIRVLCPREKVQALEVEEVEEDLGEDEHRDADDNASVARLAHRCADAESENTVDDDEEEADIPWFNDRPAAAAARYYLRHSRDDKDQQG